MNCLISYSADEGDALFQYFAHYLKSELKGNEPSFLNAVYMLNARKVSRFKNDYDMLPKNDRIDAWVIADHLRFGRLQHEMQETLQYDALHRLTRTCFHFMYEIARNKTHMMNQVCLKFSGLRQDIPFSNTFGATSIAVIEELDPKTIAEISIEIEIEKLIEFLQEKGKNRFAETGEIAKYLQKLARNSYRLYKTTTDPINLSLSVILSTIRHMEAQLKCLNQEIDRMMKCILQTLTTV